MMQQVYCASKLTLKYTNTVLIVKGTCRSLITLLMTTLIITNEDFIIILYYIHIVLIINNVYTALYITRELTILHYVLKYYLFKSIFFLFFIQSTQFPPPPPFPNDQVDQGIPLAGPRQFIEVIEYIAPLGRGTNFIWSVAND